MDDDFNTPVALSVLFELAGEANRGDAQARQLLRSLAALLGLIERDPVRVRRSGLRGAEAQSQTAGLDDAAVADRVAQRSAAKKARRFDEADRIRAELAQQGIVLEDGPSGTIWRRG
jgi:cysteinyl-tRNA synthetase